MQYSFKKIVHLSTLVISIAVLLFSCNLDDFNLDKLTDPEDLNPKVYAPLAYGSYKVDDFVNISLPDNAPVTDPVVTLDPVVYDLTGTSIRSSAVDSVYLLVTLTNGTPMKLRYKFSFIDQQSGYVYGKIYDSGLIDAGKTDATGKVTEPTIAKKEFKLGPTDLDNIEAANAMKLSVELEQPDTGTVLVKNLKESGFKVQISFYAPVKVSIQN
jgi:hypothetical protein